ncbi:MAG: P1 family peptidase [Anaerovoracaceae bacterium]
MKQISISELREFKIGHAQDEKGGTGCTAILCEKGATAGVDVRGGGPASHETELLNPVNTVEQIHCVMLSGGSAYGLEACSGAMQFLEEKGIGFDVGVGVVPLVCGASIFDLVVGDPKSRPDKAMGYKAAKNAVEEEIKVNSILNDFDKESVIKSDEQYDTFLQGNKGVGTGSSVGKYLGIDRMMKSGVGTYAVQVGEVKVAAIVGVNALGDIIDIDTGHRIAGILSEDKSKLDNTFKIMQGEISKSRDVFSGEEKNLNENHCNTGNSESAIKNTTIGCIITNAKITKAQANKLASMAQNGFARAINPVHTTVDGDTVFAMASGEVEVSIDTLGTIASEVMARAIMSAARAAEPAYGLKAAKDVLQK